MLNIETYKIAPEPSGAMNKTKDGDNKWTIMLNFETYKLLLYQTGKQWIKPNGLNKQINK